MKKNLGFEAEEYSKVAGFDGDWRDLWWNQDYLELLGRRWGLDSVRTILDVGCGAGHWGQRLATLVPDAQVTGVDHEQGFLAAAAERSKARPGRFDYRRASAEALPFDDGAFDLVTCQTVLIHVADARVALEEMIRVTRPGGLVVAAEPNNLTNALVNNVFLPRSPFDETLRLLAFEETCLRGKIALGQGDSAVGERLPALFTDLMDDVQVSTNDRCAYLAPPYSTHAERGHLQFLRDWVAADLSRWGDRGRARELFAAGGGAESEFDRLWTLNAERQRQIVRDVDAGQHVWGGGFVMYAASGRKR